MQLPDLATLYRDRLFWTLQIGAWSVYSIERAFSPGHFFPHGINHVAINVLLTSLLHPFYWWLSLRRPPLWLLTGVAVLASALGAVALPVLDHLLPVLAPATGPILTWQSVLTGSVVHLLARDRLVPFLLWSAAYLAMRHWDIARGDRERSLEAAMAARKAELKLLHAQLNPHFLFNALNSIQALIREDPVRAERVLGQFSGFLVYSLRDAASDRVPFGDEVQAIQAYIAIQKARFEDNLVVDVSASAEAMAVQVPPLLVYPLVENAIKYGMRSGPLPAQVRLEAGCRGDVLRIEVTNTGTWNPGPGDGGEDGLGLGLQNVRTRLAEIYPSRHRFAIGPDDGLIRASIEIDHA